MLHVLYTHTWFYWSNLWWAQARGITARCAWRPRGHSAAHHRQWLESVVNHKNSWCYTQKRIYCLMCSLMNPVNHVMYWQVTLEIQSSTFLVHRSLKFMLINSTYLFRWKLFKPLVEMKCVETRLQTAMSQLSDDTRGAIRRRDNVMERILQCCWYIVWPLML